MVDRYVDNDVSAYSGRRRGEYERLLADVRGGVVDAVVVWHVDRLHRQPKELEEFFEVVDQAGGAQLASVTGDVDLATHDGRFTARILGAVSRKESDDKSRRIQRQKQEEAAAGRPNVGGSRPFGYEPDHVSVRESEALVIRELAKRFIAGESIRSLCGDLNRRGVTTSTGGAWSTQTLRRLLRSGRISGQREHKGDLVGQAQWPAIITPRQTARIRALMDDPARRTTNGSARSYLLTGLLRCGVCDEKLVARPRDGRRRYVCAKGPAKDGCGGVAIMADTLEAHVVEAVLFRLDSPELAAALSAGADDPDAERWQAEADEARAQLDELALAYGEKAISMSEWMTAKAPIEARAKEARRQLAHLSRATALDGHVGQTGELRSRWDQLTLTKQRAIVAAVADHFTIARARPGFNRFDDSRVAAVWRA